MLRRIFLTVGLVAIACLCNAPIAFGCGGWWNEPPCYCVVSPCCCYVPACSWTYCCDGCCECPCCCCYPTCRSYRVIVTHVTSESPACPSAVTSSSGTRRAPIPAREATARQVTNVDSPRYVVPPWRR